MRSTPLLAMMLVRNEASRYLRDVLDDLDQYVDAMLIVDDASTDETADVCASYGRARVIRRPEPSFGNEVALRAFCWTEAVRTGAEWILAVDADEIFEDRMKREVDAMLARADVDGWTFRLYDFWGSRDHYRDDRFWQAHRHPRPFLVRNTGARPRWRDTPLHCGRLPLNAVDPSRVAHSRIRLKHLGWANAAEHQAKYEHYMRSDPQGAYGVLAQYASILDPHPRLKPWKESDDPVARRVLVGSPVRQTPAILRLFLESLRRIERSRIDLDFCFVDDNEDPESSALLERFKAEVPGVDVERPTGAPQTGGAQEPDQAAHLWDSGRIDRVAWLKDRMIARARSEGYDFLFLIDSDVLVEPGTIEHLAAQEKDIIAEVYWTRWEPTDPPLPQVWLRDQYDLQMRSAGGAGETKTDVDRRVGLFLDMLRRPGVYPVGGLGACTLVGARALARGVSFRPVPNVSFRGEDRHFCVRAAALDLGLWADTHLPAFHVYRETDVAEGEAFLSRTSRREVRRALEAICHDGAEPALPAGLEKALAEGDDQRAEREAIRLLKDGRGSAAVWRALGEALARQDFWITARRALRHAARLAGRSPWSESLEAICARFPNVGQRPYVEKLLDGADAP